MNYEEFKMIETIINNQNRIIERLEKVVKALQDEGIIDENLERIPEENEEEETEEEQKTDEIEFKNKKEETTEIKKTR